MASGTLTEAFGVQSEVQLAVADPNCNRRNSSTNSRRFQKCIIHTEVIEMKSFTLQAAAGGSQIAMQLQGNMYTGTLGSTSHTPHHINFIYIARQLIFGRISPFQKMVQMKM